MIREKAEEFRELFYGHQILVLIGRTWRRDSQYAFGRFFFEG
jgi:hypothetical protein